MAKKIATKPEASTNSSPQEETLADIGPETMQENVAIEQLENPNILASEAMHEAQDKVDDIHILTMNSMKYSSFDQTQFPDATEAIKKAAEETNNKADSALHSFQTDVEFVLKTPEPAAVETKSEIKPEAELPVVEGTKLEGVAVAVPGVVGSREKRRTLLDLRKEEATQEAKPETPENVKPEDAAIDAAVHEEIHREMSPIAEKVSGAFPQTEVSAKQEKSPKNQSNPGIVAEGEQTLDPKEKNPVDTTAGKPKRASKLVAKAEKKSVEAPKSNVEQVPVAKTAEKSKQVEQAPKAPEQQERFKPVDELAVNKLVHAVQTYLEGFKTFREAKNFSPEQRALFVEEITSAYKAIETSIDPKMPESRKQGIKTAVAEIKLSALPLRDIDIPPAEAVAAALSHLNKGISNLRELSFDSFTDGSDPAFKTWAETFTAKVKALDTPIPAIVLDEQGNPIKETPVAPKEVAHNRPFYDGVNVQARQQGYAEKIKARVGQNESTATKTVVEQQPIQKPEQKKAEPPPIPTRERRTEMIREAARIELSRHLPPLRNFTNRRELVREIANINAYIDKNSTEAARIEADILMLKARYESESEASIKSEYGRQAFNLAKRLEFLKASMTVFENRRNTLVNIQVAENNREIAPWQERLDQRKRDMDVLSDEIKRNGDLLSAIQTRINELKNQPHSKKRVKELNKQQKIFSNIIKYRTKELDKLEAKYISEGGEVDRIKTHNEKFKNIVDDNRSTERFSPLVPESDQRETSDSSLSDNKSATGVSRRERQQAAQTPPAPQVKVEPTPIPTAEPRVETPAVAAPVRAPEVTPAPVAAQPIRVEQSVAPTPEAAQPSKAELAAEKKRKKRAEQKKAREAKKAANQKKAEVKKKAGKRAAGVKSLVTAKKKVATTQPIATPQV